VKSKELDGMRNASKKVGGKINMDLADHCHRVDESVNATTKPLCPDKKHIETSPSAKRMARSTTW
jgi:hypothetical protein